MCFGPDENFNLDENLFRMRNYAILIYLSLLCYQSIAQTSDIDLKTADQELTRLYKASKIVDWEFKDSLVNTFTQNLFLTLKKPESFNYSFDSLSSELINVKSQDERIRIWSWDQHTGGSWSQYLSAVQFRTENGKIGFRQLNTGDEMMLGGYTDVYIYKIHEINEKGKVYYLTFGRGTHGSGNYHRLAQMFVISDSEFIKYEPCFENKDDLVLEIWRGDDLELSYDPVTKTISHTVLIYDEMRDRSYATEEIQQWHFQDGSFKRI